MAMSDCIKCWETPCACGHGYKDWTPERLEDQIKMLIKVYNEKTEKGDLRIQINWTEKGL